MTGYPTSSVSPLCTELNAQNLGSQQDRDYLTERVLDALLQNSPMSLVLHGGQSIVDASEAAPSNWVTRGVALTYWP